jgi:putative transcriptional regulator
MGGAMMNKKYKSEVMASIHETAEALHSAGVIGKQTMCEFDDACLEPAQIFPPAEVKEGLIKAFP